MLETITQAMWFAGSLLAVVAAVRTFRPSKPAPVPVRIRVERDER